jgi:tetratricopeptide (TPR) repeat protein
MPADEPELTAADRNRALAYFEQGQMYFAGRRWPEALAAFDHALAADPTMVRARTARVLALLYLGRGEEALAYARETLAAAPDNPFAHSALGTAYRFVHQPEEARRAYARALELGPAESRVHYNVACFHAAGGEEDAARRHLAEALRLEPKLNIMAAIDDDFASYRGREWFQELVAFKR